jgi:hypothetical protein
VFLVAFPLLIIPLAIYNMIAFLTPPDKGWDTRVVSVRLVSGVDWTITFGDALIALALLLLCVELIKAARPRSVIDHLLSTLVLIAAAAEFAMVAKVANSTFAVLCVICLVDMIAGIAISVRVSRRVAAVDRAEAPRQPPSSYHVAEVPHPAPTVHIPTPDPDAPRHAPDAPHTNP